LLKKTTLGQSATNHYGSAEWRTPSVTLSVWMMIYNLISANTNTLSSFWKRWFLAM